jgi:acyl carrier protein
MTTPGTRTTREPYAVIEVVAAAVAAKLAASGITNPDAEDLGRDPELGRRDFAALGLNSVDWMDLATTLEDAFGLEIPDEVLLDADNRSVCGWSAHLVSLSAADRAPAPPRRAENGVAAAHETEVEE